MLVEENFKCVCVCMAANSSLLSDHQQHVAIPSGRTKNHCQALGLRVFIPLSKLKAPKIDSVDPSMLRTTWGKSVASKYQEGILLCNSGSKKLNILMSSNIYFKEYNFRRFRDEN